MPPLDSVLAGFADAFTLFNLLFVVAGVAMGQLVGAIPGIGPVMAMAIAIPFTFTLDTLPAVSFLVGIMKGGLFGGAIPAVLINTPGTPDAAATTFDGHPLAAKGKPLKATKMALYSSVTGDAFSDMVLILASAPIAVIALKLGPVEVCALMIFAFAVIAGLVGDSLIKGLIAALLGLLLATVQLDPEQATPRFDFGYFQLYDGVNLVAVAVGMLAVAEIVRRMAEHDGRPQPAAVPQSEEPGARGVSWREYWGCRWTMLRGALIGTGLGALPGLGSTAAAFMSYASAKRGDPGGVPFGEGNLRGIAATESANSAVMGANLIPLLGIGIPGSVSAALLISAFVIHGIQPGPLMFRTQPELVYGIFGAMLMANLCNLIVGQLSLRAWSAAVKAPASFIFPAALIFCIAGVYLSSGGLFGVSIMLIAAAVSLTLTAVGIPVIVLLITFFLGRRFETSLSQALTILDGDPRALTAHPVALILLVGALATGVWMARRR
ncbi:tripartite tricarboxylate transporter permease [Psychromarinibacter sp. C21-152]|uniref:Tripartite tricarboxylate transporter permease n=1 Tax=Psychromarinibacter sediminicola TaxID=3033385 RepID=A0AAE3NSF9_9RHOB|nr:tripartite tricarboxylate transporter permease [Psychromarinibacter sediminicola]MDF0603438.1 tripartite tricarboxylate transporter permease [Psychromarinibacter sediminicola]